MATSMGIGHAQAVAIISLLEILIVAGAEQPKMKQTNPRCHVQGAQIIDSKRIALDGLLAWMPQRVKVVSKMAIGCVKLVVIISSLGMIRAGNAVCSGQWWPATIKCRKQVIGFAPILTAETSSLRGIWNAVAVVSPNQVQLGHQSMVKGSLQCTSHHEAKARTFALLTAISKIFLLLQLQAMPAIKMAIGHARAVVTTSSLETLTVESVEQANQYLSLSTVLLRPVLFVLRADTRDINSLHKLAVSQGRIEVGSKKGTGSVKGAVIISLLETMHAGSVVLSSL